jgi:hypothetical protein
LAVFSIRNHKNGTVWVRAGNAFFNKDGSLNIYLDVLPMDGRLHAREAGEKREPVVTAPVFDPMANREPAVAMGGH